MIHVAPPLHLLASAALYRDPSRAVLVMISVWLDRLTHHGHILESGNDSCRDKDSIAAAKARNESV